jgi:hypothetical protein
MNDDSISPGVDTDTKASNVEIPIPIDSLTVGGVEPEVGDPVKVKLTCTVVRTTNGIAWGKIDTINDLPMEAPVNEPNPLESEGDRLRDLSQSYGAINA